MADLVTKRTNGELTFDITSAQLAAARMFYVNRLGTVQPITGPIPVCVSLMCSMRLISRAIQTMPRKLPMSCCLYRAYPAVQKRYAGLRYLSVARAGPWKLFTKEKLESFDDLKGMKIRAPSIEGVIAEVWSKWAQPTVIPFNELYGALQQGVVDGMATLGNLMISQKFYEVTNYCYQNDWGIGLDKQMMNIGA